MNPMQSMTKLIILLFASLTTALAQTNSPIEQLSFDLAQAQLEAYNNRDIEAFLIPYSDSVAVYRFPNQLMYQGKELIRQRYAGMFDATPDLHCHLVSRMVQGNTVIDQELVTRKKGEPQVEAIAIYKIEHGKIQRVFFIYSD